MTASKQRPWGADGSDGANNQPAGAGWDYLTNQMGNSAANVIATTRGWETEFDGGGSEVLVAIGGLVTNLQVGFVQDRSGVVGHTATEVLKVFVQTTYGIQFAPTANLANVWIVGISNDANVANINLLYSASLSRPQSGELMFQSAVTDLSDATSLTTKITVNSTSSLHGSAAVLPRQPGKGKVALGATPFPGANGTTGVRIIVN